MIHVLETEAVSGAHQEPGGHHGRTTKLAGKGKVFRTYLEEGKPGHLYLNLCPTNDSNIVFVVFVFIISLVVLVLTALFKHTVVFLLTLSYYHTFFTSSVWTKDCTLLGHFDLANSGSLALSQVFLLLSD